MTPANTTTASSVFAGMSLCDHHRRVLQGIVVPVPYFEVRKLLKYAT